MVVIAIEMAIASLFDAEPASMRSCDFVSRQSTNEGLRVIIKSVHGILNPKPARTTAHEEKNTNKCVVLTVP